MTLVGTDINHAADLLRRGEVVGIPTETVYGLAGNALEPKAVAKIFEAKNRPFFDPLIVHIGDISQLNLWVQSVPNNVSSMLNELWPGPLTVLLKKKSIIPDITVSGNEKVAVRMPKKGMVLELLKMLDFPLAAPSANPFGYISPTTAQHVTAQLAGKVPYVLDGGPSEVGLESTIIEPLGDKCNVLRLGGMDLDKIRPYFKTLNLVLNKSSNPKAPGQLAKHYSPAKKIRLFAQMEEIPIRPNAIYILYDSGIASIPNNKQLLLSPNSDLIEAASRVFSLLRQADEMEGEEIFALQVPEVGLGMAINDRLQRAAAD